MKSLLFTFLLVANAFLLGYEWRECSLFLRNKASRIAEGVQK